MAKKKRKRKKKKKKKNQKTGHREQSTPPLRGCATSIGAVYRVTAIPWMGGG